MVKVLSVGQCAYDDSRIGRLVKESTGAFLERAASAEEALQMVAQKKYALVLVNRVFDSGGEGLKLIADLKKHDETTPVMLVSDYADAQAAAIANGAVMGFGKSALASPEVGRQLKEVVGAEAVRNG
jgi:DNA-binding NtrC family response regulator